MSLKKIPVIIDCDPGHDDMVALVLACGSGRLDVRAVTTVAGNNTIQNTTRNALNVLHYIGADEVPVAMGFQDGIVRSHKEAMGRLAVAWAERMTAEQKAAMQAVQTTGAAVHGVTGLDGFEFPPENPKQPEPVRAVEMMARVLRQSEEKVTLISTGPLTNLGLLIKAFPDLVPKIERISMMGGTSEFVLSRPGMEFNTFVDPEATKIVMESGIPITMFGYDVTYRVMCGVDTLERIEALPNRTGGMLAALVRYFMAKHNSSMNRLSLKDVVPIHDACAVAGVIDPSLVTDSRRMHVDVAVGGGLLDGATLCDHTGVLTGLPKNVEVVYDMDSARFMDLLVQAAAACK